MIPVMLIVEAKVEIISDSGSSLRLVRISSRALLRNGLEMVIISFQTVTTLVSYNFLLDMVFPVLIDFISLQVAMILSPL